MKINELGEQEALKTKIGGFKKGDYIRKVINHGGGHKSVTNGFIYYIHPTGHWVKLAGPYGPGDRSDKLIDPKGFKKITKGIPKKPNLEHIVKKPLKEQYERLFKTKLVEGFSPDDVNTIRQIVKQHKKLIGLSPYLKKAGFSSEFFESDMIPPHIMIKKGGKKYVLVNKRYADDPEWIEGDIAGGDM